MISVDEIIRHMEEIKALKISQMNRFPVDSTYHIVYSAEAVLLDEMIEYIFEQRFR